MLLAAPVLFLAQSGLKVDATVLDYHSGVFTVTKGKQVVQVPMFTAEAAKPPFLSFRKDQSYAVWDSRGLTVRHGSRSLTTQLPEVPTSPRLFDHDALVRTVADLQSGRKSRPASALSGAQRVGSDVYFLVRWDDSSRKPWMEALVRVSLAGSTLKPEVLGRFDALSVAFKPIDDRLGLLAKRLSIVGRHGKTWGVASFDSTTSKFDFRPLGDELLSFLSTGPKTGLFFEKTAYGTTVGGRIDLASGYRKVVFEGRGAGRFLDSLSPCVVVASRGGEVRLRNGESGAEITAPSGSGFARAGSGVLVWSPAAKPTSATLYDLGTWAVIASWPASAKEKP